DLEDFAAAYPMVDVRPDRYVRDGTIFTAAGASPAFDMMIDVVRTYAGPAIALDVASVFIYEASRGAGDAQAFVSLGRAEGRDRRLVEAIRIMESRIDRPVTIAAIARRLGISARALELIFRREVGLAPGAYFLMLRLNAARRLVVDTRLSFADIAGRTGFSSAASFSRAFRRAFQRSPSQMRGGGRS
ncbi:MAG: helix-turn-helix domain-containing protein, partial [Hyphomicrobiales bacterium]|nr:helix-turn-helix domain-containing protein [Hyphomicrobiales bacterium]